MRNHKNILISIVIEAGAEIMKFYGKEFEIKIKTDKSPVTEADLAANSIIVSKLKKISLPIISEENNIADYSERKKWNDFWLIDPLDGTKQFVNSQDEFTVNIALVKNNIVVEGVVYLPVTRILYYGNTVDGAIKIDFKTKDRKEENLPLVHNEKIHVVASKSHLNSETISYLDNLKNKIGNIEIYNTGSSLKFCSVAEGKADIYPRIGSINEWDIASGHAILKSAGGNVIDMQTYTEVKYNSHNLETPDFIAYRNKEYLNKIK